MSKSKHQVPNHLLKPLLLRSRESMVDNGLVYDPIAAKACLSCKMAPDCLSGDVAQKQLLHVTLTQLCDQQVTQFCSKIRTLGSSMLELDSILVFTVWITAAVTGLNWMLRRI